MSDSPAASSVAATIIPPSSLTPPINKTDELGNALDIPKILGGVMENAGKQLGISMNALSGAFGMGMSAAQQAGKGAQEEAKGATGVEAATEQYEQRVAAANANVRALQGLDSSNVNSTVVQLSKQIMENAQKLVGVNQQIFKNDQVGFFDNPIAFLTNKYINNPKLIAQREDLGGANQQYQNLLNNAAAFTTEEGKVNAISDTAAGAAKLAAFGQQQLGIAAQKAAQFQQEAARIGVSAESVRVQATEAAAKNATDQAFIGIQTRNSMLEQIGKHIEEEREPLYEEQKQAMIDARVGKQQGIDTINSKLKIAGDTLGQVPPTYQELQLLGPQQRAAWEELMQNPAVQRAGALGASPAMAMNLVDKLGFDLGPAANKTKLDLENIISPLFDLKTPLGVKYLGAKGDPGEQLGMQDELIKESFQNAAKNIPLTGHPLSPGTIYSALQMPAIQQMGISKYLAPMADSNKMTPLDPNLIFRAAIQSVTAREETIGSAADEISRMYQHVLADRIQTGQFQKFALPGSPEELGGYNFNIRNLRTGLLGGSQPTDMTNRAAVENALRRLSISERIDAQGRDIPLKRIGSLPLMELNKEQTLPGSNNP
jgi:hypothetical protein